MFEDPHALSPVPAEPAGVGALLTLLSLIFLRTDPEAPAFEVHLVFISSFTLVTAWGRALSLVVHVSETLWGPDTGALSRRCWSGCRPRGAAAPSGRADHARPGAGRGSAGKHGFPPWCDTSCFLVAPVPWPHTHFVLKPWVPRDLSLAWVLRVWPLARGVQAVARL